jgi:hypothetical protein
MDVVRKGFKTGALAPFAGVSVWKPPSPALPDFASCLAAFVLIVVAMCSVCLQAAGGFLLLSVLTALTATLQDMYWP